MPKTVIITGCSTGIGRTTAFHFARQGWNFIATMRRPEAATGFPDTKSFLVTRLDVHDAVSARVAIDGAFVSWRAYALLALSFVLLAG